MPNAEQALDSPYSRDGDSAVRWNRPPRRTLGWAYSTTVETTVNRAAGPNGPDEPGYGYLYGADGGGMIPVGFYLGGVSRTETAEPAQFARPTSGPFLHNPGDLRYGFGYGCGQPGGCPAAVDFGGSHQWGLRRVALKATSTVALPDSATILSLFPEVETQSLVLGGNRYVVTIGPFPPSTWGPRYRHGCNRREPHGRVGRPGA
jgi:hypothetical protein